MPIDQNITYRVNVDDSNFQAKLTQMRASLDATMGGLAGGGFSPGFSFNAMGAMGSLMRPGNFGPMNLGGGYADFGSQIMPVTFTPPAISMQPHFGMYQVTQTLGQAGLASIGGPLGIMAMDNTRGLTANTEMISPRISHAEYIAASARNFGGRMGDVAAAGGLAGANLGASTLLGGMGAAAGSSLFSSGIGRAFGGIMGGMLVGTAVSQYFGAVSDRMAENIGIQNTLAQGSFRFISGANADPLTGRGFNIADRRRVADAIQGMESRDVRFNMTDYSQILEGGMQMDMFSGTRDADDFKRKFKDLVDNVKTVSSTLHTSLREGLEVIRGMRDMGVEGSGVSKLTVQSEVMGRASGRTGMEMLSIGQAGAEMFRGTGITMERGFTLAQQNAQMIRTMLNAGTISREVVAQAGGETALAQHMTAGALSGFQTMMGRGAMMAHFNPATGNFDPEMVQKMMRGDAMSVMANAANLGPQGIFQLQAHQEELISKLSPMQMQMFSVAQRMSSARMLQGAFGGNLKDLFIAESKRQGVNIEQVKTELGMLTTDPARFAEEQQAGLNTMARQAALEDFRDRFGGKAISNALTRTFIDPVRSRFLDIRQNVEQTVSDAAESSMNFLLGARTADKSVLTREKMSYARELVDAKVQDKIEAQRAQGKEVTPELERSLRDEEILKSAGGILIDDNTGLRRLWGQSSKGLADAFAGNINGDKATVGGVTGSVVESKAAAEAMAKQAGEPMQLLTASNGKMIAVKSSDLGKVAEFGRKFAVSDEAIAKAKGVDRQKLATIGAGLESLKDLSLEERMAFIGHESVKDFNVQKFLSGDVKEEDLAQIMSIAKKTDPAMYAAIRERQSLSGKAVDAAAGAREQLTAAGATSGKEARDLLMKEVGGGDMSMGTAQRQKALNEIISGSKGGEFLQEYSRFLSGEKGSNILLKQILNESVGDDKVRKDLQQHLFAVKGSKEGKQIMEGLQREAIVGAGASSVIGGQVTGMGQAGDYMLAGTVDVSQKTLQAVTEFAKTTQDQIRLLQTLVNELQGQLGGLKR